MNRIPQKRWWFYVLVPAISAIFTLVVVEIALLIFHPIPFSIETNMYFEEDAYTGYRLKPNATGYFQDQIIAQTNEHGHRDRSIPIEKTDESLRILVLGDSFTVGANVKQEDAYPQVLESLLNKNSAQPIVVINAGVGGWEPFNYAQYYENYGNQFSPDLILIGFFVGNDTYN